MQIRAAVLEETGGALTVQELELAPPGPLVRPLRGLPPGLHVAVLHRLAGEGAGLYRTGNLPLDRLISHRLPLHQVEHAFDLMKSGDALRVILELSSA